MLHNTLYKESIFNSNIDEPSYVKLYLDDLIRIKNLPKGASKILYQLIKIMNCDGQIILNAAIKRRIGLFINAKEQSVSNLITCLIQKDIIKRIDTGIYMINLNFFAKEAWGKTFELMKKNIELTITYTTKGEKFLESKLKKPL